jgi:Flp pilus assembly protein TadB
MEKLFPNQQVKETQKRPVKKKKKKSFKRWGTMIPSGFVFLGIAILLSLININGLALLFGVAAILFLFLGFRKLLRRKRRRDIFR